MAHKNPSVLACLLLELLGLGSWKHSAPGLKIRRFPSSAAFRVSCSAFRADWILRVGGESSYCESKASLRVSLVDGLRERLGFRVINYF